MSNFYADKIDLQKLRELYFNGEGVAELSAEGADAIRKTRTYLVDKLAGSNKAFYGINTGFGDLHDKRIDNEDLEQLQENLIRSHACGTGDLVPEKLVRMMILLKIRSLSFGYSGIRIETVERLAEMYSKNITPVVYTQGSLGASGDLAPLAHLSLALIGAGEVYYKGEQVDAAEALKAEGLEPLKLGSKEGLALLNGTQFMLAYGLASLFEAERLMHFADLIGAASVDGFACKKDPFDHRIHDIRPHAGQVETARMIRELLADSEIFHRKKEHVQDPYAFRCIPQVHGASKDAIAYCRGVYETELNSVSDNPNIFADDDRIISGGNFHGQPLALAADFLAIAMAEIGSISERRVFQLLSGRRGLPPFLVAEPGLNSGLMIAQYTAAGIVSENKQLCTPASVDTIPSSNGQEDHVSMGANAAVKLMRVIRNVERVLAIELITASQALSFRDGEKSGKAVEELITHFRERVPVITQDRVLSHDIADSVEFLRS